jgi:hypothetical protein
MRIPARLEATYTLQSSALRTKPYLRFSNSQSTSSKSTLANIGDKGPPCGVPACRSIITPLPPHPLRGGGETDPVPSGPLPISSNGPSTPAPPGRRRIVRGARDRLGKFHGPIGQAGRFPRNVPIGREPTAGAHGPDLDFPLPGGRGVVVERVPSRLNPVTSSFILSRHA